MVHDPTPTCDKGQLNNTDTFTKHLSNHNQNHLVGQMELLIIGFETCSETTRLWLFVYAQSHHGSADTNMAVVKTSAFTKTRADFCSTICD
jgi:hypothetical protein